MFTCFGSDGARVYKFDGKQSVEVLKSIPSNQEITLKKTVVSGPHKLFLLHNNGVDYLNLKDLTSSRVITTDALRIAVSPCSKVAFVFRNYVAPSNNVKESPNVSAVDTETKVILKEYVHRALDGWQPQWNSNSSVCALHWNGEIQFYANNEFGEKPIARLAVKGMRHFSLSSNPNTPSLAVYVPSQKDQPANVRVFQLRNGQCTAITNKSFYRADTVRLIWNDSGTDLLVLTSTKVSDESYYGEQGLHYLTTKQSRDTAVVVMPRKGPIYQVAWKPVVAGSMGKSNAASGASEDLFVVCYGFQPASVTVFGTDCEARFDFGSGSWNQLYFNPHGNLLLLAGLGSLTGDMCVWNFAQYEKLSTFKTTDVTSVSWLNDGEHLLLSTTTPRLRVNNGFRIWHYSGKELLSEKVAARAVPRPATFDLPAATEHELYDVQVIPQFPLPPAPKPKKFDSVQIATVPSSTKSGVYVPPALRNRSAVAKQAVAAMHTVGSKPATSVNFPVGLDPELCNAGKQKKKKKANKSSAGDQPSSAATAKESEPASSGDPGKSKLKSQIRKKLSQIEKLKADQAGGKQLDPNQMEKLSTEKQLRAQLAELSLSN